MDFERAVNKVGPCPATMGWTTNSYSSISPGAASAEVVHGSDRDDDPAAFRMLLTLDEQAGGRTIVTLRQMHPTGARRDEAIGFGAVDYGLETLGKGIIHTTRSEGSRT